MSPLHASYEEPSYWGRRVFIVLVALVALAAAGYAGSKIGPHFASSDTTTTTTHPHSTTATTLAHAKVKVQVANGTQEANAAAHFSQILQQQGWNVLAPENATAAATATTIYYGAFFMQPASDIASQLGVAATTLQPLTPTTPVPNTSSADVVVIIGPDLAGSGFPPTS